MIGTCDLQFTNEVYQQHHIICLSCIEISITVRRVKEYMSQRLIYNSYSLVFDIFDDHILIRHKIDSIFKYPLEK